MTNKLGSYGFYLNIISMTILVLVILDVIAGFLLLIVTFGFIADDPDSHRRFLFETLPTLGVKISFGLTVLSVPLLIAGIVQHKRGLDTASDFQRTVNGLILGSIILIIFVGAFAFQKGIGILYKKQLESRIEYTTSIPPSCDKRYCENLGFSEEENILSFTLINPDDQPMILTSLYDTASCTYGIVEHFQASETEEPTVIRSAGPFSIPVEANGKVPIAMKCQGDVPPFNAADFTGHIGFRFNQGDRTELNFHIYL